MDENNLLQQCWICMDQLRDYILLPEEDEYFGEDIGIFKNTFIIKKFYSNGMERLPVFSFLYFTCCNSCINNYLKYYGRFYKTLNTRELSGKM
tara:strand:- start:11187 stop:11465 length:279 start_codon:yes stop_codon:yes gene_type:complete